MVSPILIIFEQHWDEKTKILEKKLIQRLAKEDYDTFCVEAPQSCTSEEIRSRHDSSLALDSEIYKQAKQCLKDAGIKTENKLSDISFKKLEMLMKRCVSSEQYTIVAEKIKNLPASKIYGDILKEAHRLSVSVMGIDIDNFDQIPSTKFNERMKKINEFEDERIKTMYKNLTKLWKTKSGVIFTCGVMHAPNLVSKFKENGINDSVVYYFPYSEKLLLDESFKGIMVMASNRTLQGHSYCLSNDKDINLLANKIVEEIKSKKAKVLDKNSHSAFLSRFFGVNFQAFCRPGYYVDALLKIDEITKALTTAIKLHQSNIKVHCTLLQHQWYLVVPEVNTKKVAEKINELRH